MKYPRSPYNTVGGLVYFGRMIDKIRLFAADELHPELHNNLGKGFDEKCTNFLQVSYDAVVKQVTEENQSDEALLEWCFTQGRRPGSEEIQIWNGFLRKWGWNDEASDLLARRIKESGFEGRQDIQTFFDYLDADEGRPVGGGA